MSLALVRRKQVANQWHVHMLDKPTLRVQRSQLITDCGLARTCCFSDAQNQAGSGCHKFMFVLTIRIISVRCIGFDMARQLGALRNLMHLFSHRVQRVTRCTGTNFHSVTCLVGLSASRSS